MGEGVLEAFPGVSPGDVEEMKLPEIHPYGVEEYPKIGNYLPCFIGHIMVFGIHCAPPESVYLGNGGIKPPIPPLPGVLIP